MLQSLTCGGLVVAIAALELLCASATAQQRAITTQVLGRVDSRRSSEGCSFFVKTSSAWNQGRCSIPTERRGGRALAHVGGVLAIYGPGLKVEREWSPLGDVRFLRVSPSRHLIVAVVMYERHTDGVASTASIPR
jgi:hypothetical protein